MVKVRYRSGEGRYELSLKGHAGAGAYGCDIICAGVSAITYALMGYLELTRKEASCLDINYAEGDVTILCEGHRECGSAFQMAITGYEMIADKYPQYISVDILSADRSGDTRNRARRKEHL